MDLRDLDPVRRVRVKLVRRRQRYVAALRKPPEDQLVAEGDALLREELAPGGNLLPS